MNSDRYTKAVLTVIAGCLLWICAMGVAPRVEAQQSTVQITGPAQPVVLVGTGFLDRQGRVVVNFNNDKTDPTVPVQLPYSAAKPLQVSLPYTPSAPMPARLTNAEDTPLPVAITAVKKFGDWEPIRTKVEDAPVKRTPGGGHQ